MQGRPKRSAQVQNPKPKLRKVQSRRTQPTGDKREQRAPSIEPEAKVRGGLSNVQALLLVGWCLLSAKFYRTLAHMLLHPVPHPAHVLFV